MAVPFLRPNWYRIRWSRAFFPVENPSSPIGERRTGPLAMSLPSWWCADGVLAVELGPVPGWLARAHCHGPRNRPARPPSFHKGADQRACLPPWRLSPATPTNQPLRGVVACHTFHARVAWCEG